MSIKAFSKWIMVVGVLFIWFIKFYARPFAYIPAELKLLCDVAPNFVGSFLLPFGACCMFQKFFRLQNLYDLRLTCIFGLFLVIVNEYLQLIPFFGRTFDYLDILASIAGVLLGYAVFSQALVKMPQAATPVA